MFPSDILQRSRLNLTVKTEDDNKCEFLCEAVKLQLVHPISHQFSFIFTDSAPSQSMTYLNSLCLLSRASPANQPMTKGQRKKKERKHLLYLHCETGLTREDTPRTRAHTGTVQRRVEKKVAGEQCNTVLLFVSLTESFLKKFETRSCQHHREHSGRDRWFLAVTAAKPRPQKTQRFQSGRPSMTQITGFL